MSIYPKNKVIVIVGPTASGKSALAVSLARRFKGEIISADSRQVYKNLNIGTGKVTKKEMMGVPHWCLDLLSLKKTCTVQYFAKEALRAIRNIEKQRKLPVVVGGTGLYVQAILHENFSAPVSPNRKLRKELDGKSPEELHDILKSLDPVRAKNIDAKNPRRLIRAIEIAKALGSVPSRSLTPRFDALMIGLHPEKEMLQKLISRRVGKMMKQGLLEETKMLRRKKVSRARIMELGFEYIYPLLYLEGKISKDEMLRQIKTKTWQYAKRQMTWFKREKNIVLIKNKKETIHLVKHFLKGD